MKETMLDAEGIEVSEPRTLREELRLWPFSSAMRRLRRSFQAMWPKTSTGFCYIREAGEDWHSRFWIHNYWTENYKIPNPAICYKIFDPQGSHLAAGKKELSGSETWVIEARDLLERHSIPLPFEGSILFATSNRSLRPNSPLQFFCEYSSPSTPMSTVHGQGRLDPTRGRWLTECINVLSDPDWETHIVLQNCLQEEGAPVEVNVIVKNSEGKERSWQASSIPSRGCRRVCLQEAFPDLSDFLGGKNGNATVEMSSRTSRLLFFHKNHVSNRISVNHAVLLKNFPIFTLEEFRQLGLGPVIAAPAWERDGLHSRYIIYGNFVEEDAASWVVIDLFSQEGRLLSRQTLPLISRRTLRVELRDLLQKASRPPLPFEGSIRVSVAPQKPTDLCPRTFNLVMEFYDADGLCEVATGSQLYNPPQEVPKGMLARGLLWGGYGTNVFRNVIEDDSWQTHFMLINPQSFHPGTNQPSDTLLRLLDAAGRGALERKVRVNPNGCLAVSIEDFFGGAGEFLRAADGKGTIHVKDKATNLIGFVMFRQRATGALACDHLLGG